MLAAERTRGGANSMAVEIERKFLVDTSKLRLQGGERIVQGYVPTAGKHVVRVRIKGESAYLTLKSANVGIERREFEYPVPVADAEEMLRLFCAGHCIDKQRYRVQVGAHCWEVDVFAGDNHGLVVAEVELASADEAVELPDWVLEEVSGDPRYYNNNLLTHPFQRW